MRTWTIAVLLLVALLVASCSSGDSSGDPQAAGDEPQAPPLECETKDYPCSLADVPIEILERSDTLGNDALDMLESGESVQAVESWLNGQEGMAEVTSDAEAIRYRLEGGRGEWIVRSSALATRGAPGVPSAIRPNAPDIFPHIAGPNLDSKKALVLSPMMWDFGITDDGPVVAGIMGATKGYESGVTFAANEKFESTAVGVGSFTGWSSFQVVHVVTHGTTLCNEGTSCRAVIFASSLQGEAPQGQGVHLASELKKSLTARGLETAKVEGSRGLELEVVDFVVLTSDFFTSQYGSGLNDTFIFFNACETFSSGATDIADALRGTTSVFVGWSDTVDSDTALAAATALYTDLSEGGYPADIAFDQLSSGLKTDSVGGKSAQLILGDRKDGDGLRIREVVELLDPSGAELDASTKVPIIGQAGDGEEDSAPYLVQVDGMTPEIASDAILHVSIDGVESDPQPVTDGSSLEMDKWLLGGEIPLGYDLEEDKVVDFRAWVELPDGGESDDETPATLSGAEPIMGYEWVLEAENIVGFPGGRTNSSTAILTLEFEEGQAFDEPYPRYVVTSGTATYGSRAGEALGCRYSGGGLTFDVTPDMVPGALVFNTTVTPVEYQGVISTRDGPDDSVVQDCTSIGPGYGVNTISYGGNTSWVIADTGDHRTVDTLELIDESISWPSEYGYWFEYTITRTR